MISMINMIFVLQVSVGQLNSADVEKLPACMVSEVHVTAGK